MPKLQLPPPQLEMQAKCMKLSLTSAAFLCSEYLAFNEQDKCQTGHTSGWEKHRICFLFVVMHIIVAHSKVWTRSNSFHWHSCFVCVKGMWVGSWKNELMLCFKPDSKMHLNLFSSSRSFATPWELHITNSKLQIKSILVSHHARCCEPSNIHPNQSCP